MGATGVSVKERKDAELALIQAMYPGQIEWSAHTGEIRYISDEGGSLILRLPESYPEEQLPEIISATDSQKNDVRTAMREELVQLQLFEGEEVLDSIILSYQHLDQRLSDVKTHDQGHEVSGPQPASEETLKIVIIWLHHLLATTKRKLALNPTLDSKKLSGITKPGYPGILVLSGAAAAVDAHVSELREQRWQAFQVRLEEHYRVDEPIVAWKFEHGDGIKEVETMSEVVQEIIGEGNKQTFLKAVGLK